ncbi:hypothetical protein CPARA_2gp269 (nucleomorph) [Cryptomonas paramecium]|uniref:Uncharacterized protein n=1 Tax=Cryptomonas paramaecium TaxID=2898 RepID=F2HHY1_9CRYP|nr:hypothetical protein CPARA_2gp269 [Cryptomonas paramecium]AEA38927.1 hypothetical protein CPARA_2gp269 [Cryptomonas paramecium]|mmetsp:Transcript_5524/g.17710  ORF Transcript_5524/g.17710 Transcript_5524/m.17710 type:complete len:271 (-) Transcript_5524:10161-10973(-)
MKCIKLFIRKISAFLNSLIQCDVFCIYNSYKIFRGNRQLYLKRIINLFANKKLISCTFYKSLIGKPNFDIFYFFYFIYTNLHSNLIFLIITELLNNQIFTKNIFKLNQSLIPGYNKDDFVFELCLNYKVLFKFTQLKGCLISCFFTYIGMNVYNFFDILFPLDFLCFYAIEYFFSLFTHDLNTTKLFYKLLICFSFFEINIFKLTISDLTILIQSKETSSYAKKFIFLIFLNFKSYKTNLVFYGSYHILLKSFCEKIKFWICKQNLCRHV